MGEKSKRTIDLNQYGWDPLFNQINMTHAIIDDDFYGAKWVKGKRVGRQYHTTIYNGWLHQNTEDKKNHEIAYVYKRFLATSNTVIFHKGLFTDLNLKSKKYPKAAKHFNSVLKNATPLDTNQAKAFYLLLKDYLLETFQNEKSPLRKALKESGYSNIIYSSENNSLLGFNSKGKGDNMVGELLSHIRDGTIDNNKENSTQTLDELLKVYSDSLTNPEKNNYLCIPSDIEIRADNFPGGKVNYY